MKKGKKTLQWERVRKSLKREFENKGLTFCESCGTNFGLSFAHRSKRRFITDEAELRQVAILCVLCHEKIERLPHSQMFDRITEIIEQRS